jgi:deoxyribonuclease-1-like protein
MQKTIFLLLILINLAADNNQTYSITSWNIKDFGKTKSEAEIDFMAKQLSNFDIVAIQEVVAGTTFGAKAVAKLDAALDRTGTNWDYKISNPTTGSGYESERYAYLWKTSKVKLIGRPYLEVKYEQEIVREPFVAQFQIGKQKIRLFNIHAIPKSKQPEREIKYLKYFPAKYPNEILFFLGDFNLPQKHTVFNPLKKKGYKPALINQKTSLKMKRKNDDFLASEFDNIFYDSNKTQFKSAGIVNFTTKFQTLKEARTISDHVPVFLNFQLN